MAKLGASFTYFASPEGVAVRTNQPPKAESNACRSCTAKYKGWCEGFSSNNPNLNFSIFNGPLPTEGEIRNANTALFCLNLMAERYRKQKNVISHKLVEPFHDQEISCGD